MAEEEKGLFWLMLPGHGPLLKEVRAGTQGHCLQTGTLEECCWLAHSLVHFLSRFLARLSLVFVLFNVRGDFCAHVHPSEA